MEGSPKFTCQEDEVASLASETLLETVTSLEAVSAPLSEVATVQALGNLAAESAGVEVPPKKRSVNPLAADRVAGRSGVASSGHYTYTVMNSPYKTSVVQKKRKLLLAERARIQEDA